jgi:arabinofuranosyltransferase
MGETGARPAGVKPAGAMAAATIDGTPAMRSARIAFPVLGSMLVASAVLSLRVARLYNPHLVVDDAFISFRYADNFAHGLGLVYNPGERVEGYSNFLWTVLLAAGLRLRLDVVPLAIALSFLAALGTIGVLVLWSHRLFRDRPGGLLMTSLAPLLFAAAGSQARYVVSGMETLLFGFLVLFAAYLFYVRGLSLAAGSVFALAAMTRPEGFMYWGLALAISLLPGRTAHRGREEIVPDRTASRRSEEIVPDRTGPRGSEEIGAWHPAKTWAAQAAGRPRRALLLALGFAALFGPYFVWRYHYYGWLLPNTYYAKAAGFSAARIIRGWGLLGEVAGWWSVYPLLLIALAALPAVRRGSATLRLSAAYVAATALYFVYVGGDFLVFFGPRFLMPALPFLLLLASEGLYLLSRFPERRAGWRSVAAGAGRRRRFIAGGAVLLANAFCLSWPARHANLEALAVQMQSWEELGRWIGPHTPVAAVLATGGAGIVPYYSRRFTIDMYGLADLHVGHMSPLAVGYKQVAHEKFDPAYVLDRKPDLLLTAVDRTGTPRTAGLARVKDRVWACYHPLVFLKEGGSAADRHLLLAAVFSPALADAGYGIALWERRQGKDAGRCARLEGAPEATFPPRQVPAAAGPGRHPLVASRG